MINERNVRFIEGLFGKDWYIGNEQRGEIVFHCPFCPDKGHRNNDYKLYVNTNSLKYQCFRCKSSGSLNSEISSDFAGNDIYDAISRYLNNNQDDSEETDYFHIPKSLLVDYKDSEGYQYMINRGFSEDDMIKYSMRLPGVVGGLYGRVLIPNRIISKNWTDMYVARSYNGSDIRYKNPPNSRKSKILFNYHNIPDNPDYMIINEGPLNSIIAGDYSVASFGKGLSSDQLKLVLDKHPRRVYVSFDTDALEYSIRTCESIVQRSRIEVYLVELPDGKDAVNLGKSKYMEYIDKSIRFTNRRIYSILSGVI